MTAITEKLAHRDKKKFSVHQLILIVIVMLFVLICVLPFLNVIAVSLSSKSAILRGDVMFVPIDPTFLAYRAIFSDETLFTSLWFTVKMTVIYTAMAMVLTILLAYPLTKKRLKGRTFFLLFTVFTMYFQGGTIPTYLSVKSLGLIDTMWSLILPGALATYNMVILKSFFTAIPQELEEAAVIDGATDFQVLVRVYLPLSLSSICTLSLFYAVGRWNGFSDALYYITDRSLQPLQLKLYNIIKGSTTIDMSAIEGGAAQAATEVSASIESATIIFATLPILLIYPFVQRYFVKGVTIGALKG